MDAGNESGLGDFSPCCWSHHEFEYTEVSAVDCDKFELFSDSLSESEAELLPDILMERLTDTERETREVNHNR